MISFINILLILFWLGIMPFLLGSFIEAGYAARCQMTYNKLISRTLVFGLAFMLASFQLIAVPFIYLGLSFTMLTNVWSAVIIVCATVSVCALFYNRKFYVKKTKMPRRSYRFRNKIKSFFGGKDMETILIWAFAIIMIAFQTSLLIFRQHIDTDDARFLAVALEAYEKNTLLRVHPITGEKLYFPIGEMTKDLFSPYPLLIAVLARLTMLHPTILAHTVFPIFLIPLSYCAMYVIGRYFFDDKRNSGVFMFVLSIIVLFSFESMFSIGYTLLTIIWQGRSIYMTIFLPFMFYIYIQIYTEGVRNNYIYFVLLLLCLAAADLSGTANILTICLGATYALCECLVNRKLKSAVLIGVTLIPSFVYFLMWRM